MQANMTGPEEIFRPLTLTSSDTMQADSNSGENLHRCQILLR